MPSNHQRPLNTTLARTMRRKGVGLDEVPSIERWTEFVLAIDATLDGYETNRELLDASAKIASSQLRDLYERLKAESSLRLAESDRHKRELEDDVRSRTADLWEARRRLEVINARLQFDATHDSLTGMYNRSFFLSEIQERFARCVEDGWSSRFAVFYADFNNFKRINDSLGHGTGDQLLVAVADRLQGILADGDCLARLGGDEFTIVCAVPKEGDELAFGARVAEQFEAPFDINGMEVELRASVGAVVAHPEHQTVDEIMRDADIAMYRAKGDRLPFVLFDHHLMADIQETLTMERELRVAIAERQFVVHFEPVVDINDNRVCSTESLVRWIHPTHGALHPERFMPTAQESGAIAGIDRLVFDQTCQALRNWIDHGTVTDEHKVNVNVSSAQLGRPDFIPFLVRTLSSYGLTTSHVVIEILETHLLEDVGQAADAVHKLAELGFEVFIDDFGTGYSSLSYLAKYPIHGLKIDRMFVREAEATAHNRELIRSIVAMAEALNVMVIVEGVETLEQLRLVWDLGCRHVQGFVFTESMDASSAEQFLRNGKHRGAVKAIDDVRVDLSARLAA